MQFVLLCAELIAESQALRRKKGHQVSSFSEP